MSEHDVQSESVQRIAMALACFQAEVSNVARDGRNPFHHSRYPTLTACIDAIRAPLAKLALAFTQTTEPDDRGPIIITTLLHDSGEWLRGRLLMPVVPPCIDTVEVTNEDGTVEQRREGMPHNAQAMGSVITYGRRYGLMAILGLAPAEDDDDGEAAVGRGGAPRRGRRGEGEKGAKRRPQSRPAAPGPQPSGARPGGPRGPQAPGLNTGGSTPARAPAASSPRPSPGPSPAPRRPPAATAADEDGPEQAVQALKDTYHFTDETVKRWLKHFGHERVAQFTRDELEKLAVGARKVAAAARERAQQDEKQSTKPEGGAG